MRRALLFPLISLWLALTACGGEPRVAAGPPSRVDLKAAWTAYRGYCEPCHGAATCCLSPADFSAEKWSPSAGPYLRALRTHYECMLDEAMVAGIYEPSAAVTSSEFPSFRTIGNFRRVCEASVCTDSADAMAAELDRALVNLASHPEGALVVCSASSTQ